MTEEVIRHHRLIRRCTVIRHCSCYSSLQSLIVIAKQVVMIVIRRRNHHSSSQTSFFIAIIIRRRKHHSSSPSQSTPSWPRPFAFGKAWWQVNCRILATCVVLVKQLKHVGEKKKSFIRDLYFSYPYGCILLYYLCIFNVFNENVWKYGNCPTSSQIP